MKKRSITLLMLGMAVSVFAAACTSNDPGTETKPGTVVELTPENSGVDVTQAGNSDSAPVDEEPVAEEPEEEEDVIPEGMYRSELTNEFIPLELKDQRPIAVMTDNEITALPHYGTSDADIVYEMMNSTANGRITRLMPIIKDWKNIKQFGSVRSARPTNFMVAAEYNAILCHDGGPYYINQYTSKDYTNNLSGGFARFSNGKSTEYTEYITFDAYTNPSTGKSYDGLGTRIQRAGYSETYNQFYPGEHFEFSNKEINLSDSHNDAFKAKDVILPFPHNKSELHYNEEIGKYEYYEYGNVYVDEGNANKHLTFENVIIQKCSFTQLDEHGYLIYNILVGQPWDGYLLQNGEAVPINWVKYGESERCVYMYADTSHIVLNTGKTYIAIVPDDAWNELKIN
ncbi:MAG: DUF3048 domain-containing protein [Lachnospiraceae bacterium]|nr:DUF3048 domain-containing protein [Lachnospiraceae bacterium]